MLITEAEIEEALKTMQERKAAGACGTPPEHLKQGGVAMKRELTKLFVAIMEEQAVPAE